jgi:hypothetical protein
VVKVEYWVTRRSEQVSTWVTVDGEMSATVGSDVVGEWNTLKLESEVGDILSQ